MQESKPALDLIILSSAPIEQLLLGFEYLNFKKELQDKIYDVILANSK